MHLLQTMVKFFAVLMLSVACFCGCRTHAAPDQSGRMPLRVTSEDPSFINALAGLPQFAVETVAIGATEQRLLALQHDKIDLATAVADLAYLGFAGRLPNQPGTFDGIRGVALLRRTSVHVLSAANANLAGGFRGKRIVLGRPTGGNASIGERLVTSSGVSVTEFQGEFLPVDRAIEKLVKGQVDVVIQSGRLPIPNVVEAHRHGARLLNIDGPAVDGLRTYYPLLRRTLIPKGTYPGQDEAIRTVGIDLLLICRANLSSEVVFELTRAYFETFPADVRRFTDPRRAPATVIPLHPGAARYYREREMRR